MKHLSVIGYLQDLIRVVVPPTNLLHPGREAAVGPRLLISRPIVALNGFSTPGKSMPNGHATFVL